MTAIFEHLLQSNAIPSDDEAGQIREFCKGSTTELEQLNAEIEALQTALKERITRRHELEAKLEAHRALVSPLRRLPPELLQRVFFLCLQPFSCLDSSEPPIVLSQVCQRWRQVAIATPGLWASMHIVFPCQQLGNTEPQSYTAEGVKANCDALSAAIKLWLERSQELPLSLSIYESNTYGVNTRDEFGRLLAALVPHSRRWKFLEITLSEDREMTVLTNLQAVDIPLLETLKMRVYSYRQEEDLQKSWQATRMFLGSIPNLRKIHLERFFPEYAEFPPLPWSQLQDVSITINSYSWSANDVLEALSGCSNLKTLTFRGYRGDEDTLSIAVTLPLLEKLVISCTSTTTCGLLDHMTLPKLNDVDLSKADESQHSPIDSLRRLIARSGEECMLLRLQYPTDPAFNDYTQLVDMLKLAPKMQDLCLVHSVLRDPLLSTLTNVEGEVLCPELEKLQFVIEEETANEDVITFLRARCNPPPNVKPFQQVDILSYSMNTAFNKRIEQLGDPVSIQYSFASFDSCFSGRPEEY